MNSFRKARPNDRMPRLLLIVDEFQEFFVEDDALSAAANLLLDRLVRQGRAFGIHVLLGSQTLGGAYSLARSTLGQVAVRIALQCSESDAHLILSEENAAARLLTRPGEAIYNDSNGLLEGNHPFQIAWLPDDRRDDFLSQVQEIANAQGVVVQPAIVFEGNVASDPANNPDIVKFIESFSNMREPEEGQPAHPLSVWLGEPVSIRPPTPVQFNRRPGDNLIIVGPDAPSAQGILAVSVITLAAQLHVADASAAAAQFYLLDGDAIDAGSPAEWKHLAQRMPHRIVPQGQRGGRDRAGDRAGSDAPHGAAGQRRPSDFCRDFQFQPVPRPEERAGRFWLLQQYGRGQSGERGQVACRHLPRWPGGRRAYDCLVRHLQQLEPLDDATIAP